MFTQNFIVWHYDMQETHKLQIYKFYLQLYSQALRIWMLKILQLVNSMDRYLFSCKLIATSWNTI
jgi:hypothetical protein